MNKPFFTDESLLIFIKNAPISDEDKAKLIEVVPGLDDAQRIGLLEAMRDVSLLDLEEKEQSKKLEEMMSVLAEGKEEAHK